ncbi:MAG: magnesium chelatase, partial [Candidatus Dormibacteraeota bacterium]|nr:magnesium chelatase [Candidatus Dormibacteraeota bacterium]
MKMALVLNAINPSIGGVLIRGEKGTGKSTAVRALARLLPEQQVV